MTTELQPDARLFQLFFDCYNVFNDRFDVAASRDALICFGVSGAGKSTFLARLISREAPVEFHKSLPNNASDVKDNKVTKEGIVLGAGFGSTTLVPVVYPVGNQRIFDVPGFKDTDVNREVVINILHKCLLTRVQRAKFLVIINVHDLFQDEKFGKIVDDYHNKLKELFGEANYQSFIETLHFVLTHNDGGEFNTEAIDKRLRELINDIFTRKVQNSYLAHFINRIQTNHMLVDYTSQTGQELHELLNKAVTQDTDMGTRIPEIQRDKLDIHANKMNMFCVRTMDRKVEDLISVKTTHLETFATNHEKVLLQRRQVLDAETKLESQTTEKKNRSSSIERNLETIKINQRVIHESKDEIEKTLFRIATLQDQLKFLQSEVSAIESVSLRADVARQTGRITNEYTFRSTVMLSPKEYENSTILVVADEPNDETLRRHMQNNGSLVPTDIRRVQQCAQEVIWYNSHMRSANLAFLSMCKAQYNPRTGHSDMHFVSHKKFKVLIYTAVDFDSTPAALVLRGHYGRELQVAEQKLNSLKADKTQAETDIETAEKSIVNNRALLVKLEEDIKVVTVALNAKKVDFERIVGSANNAIAEAKLEANMMRIGNDADSADGAPGGQDKDVTLIKKIEGIFRDNQLKTDLTNAIHKHETIMSELLSDISTAMGSLESVSKAEVVKPPSQDGLQ